MDPIYIGESQVLLVVEYLRCGQVAMLLLYYKSEALMPQATALVVVVEVYLSLPVSANNQLTFVTFTQLNCEQPALVYGLAGN